MSDYLCGRGLTVTNCYFHDCYVRGVLLRSPDSVIEGCTFERINNGAIVLLPERQFQRDLSRKYYNQEQYDKGLLLLQMVVHRSEIQRCNSGGRLSGKSRVEYGKYGGDRNQRQ